MTKTLRVLLFFVLPILAVMSYPPESLGKGAAVLLVALAFFIGLGVLLWRGYDLALTFSIFVQGMNAIIRLMMFFPNAVSTSGALNETYAIANVLGLVLSVWLLLRLDQQDVRLQMTR